MPLSIDGIAWSEKRDEIKQASINRSGIGFIPFFGQMSVHNRGIAKKDICLSMDLIWVGIEHSARLKNTIQSKGKR
jgi:hypothetical protein